MIAVSLLTYAPPPACAADAGELLSLIRIARGDRIATTAKLNAIAEERADEIVADFSHDGADHGLAEILAWNSYPEDLTEATAVQQWLNSPGHRAILLDDYTHVGVGVADADPQHFYAAVFARIERPKPVSKGINPAVLPNTDTEAGC